MLYWAIMILAILIFCMASAAYDDKAYKAVGILVIIGIALLYVAEEVVPGGPLGHSAKEYLLEETELSFKRTYAVKIALPTNMRVRVKEFLPTGGIEESRTITVVVEPKPVQNAESEEEQ